VHATAAGIYPNPANSHW